MDAVRLHRTTDKFDQLTQFKRLLKIIVSALFHCTYGGFDSTVGRDDDDRQVGLTALELLHERDAVHWKHHEIDEGDIVWTLAQNIGIDLLQRSLGFLECA